MIESLLAVCPFAPWPVRDGFTLRMASLLEALAREVPQLTMLSPAMPEDWLPPPGFNNGRVRHVSYAARPVGRQSPLTWSGMDVWPWENDPYAATAPIAGLLAERRFDAVLGWPGIDPALLGLAPQAACLDLIDCNSLTAWRQFATRRSLAGRWPALRECFNHWAYERRLLRGFKLVSVVGPRDAAALGRFRHNARIAVVPNGVDSESFRPVDVPKAPMPTVVFTGTMSYLPNIDAAAWFATEVWPQVVRRIPEGRLLVVGARPGPAVVALAADPTVTVTGRVEDIRDPLSRAWVSVAPMRSGAGIKNKVLEAWAVGLPVVGTTLAFNGLEGSVSGAALVADSADAMAESVATLLADPARRTAMGARGRAVVQTEHGWTRAARQLLSEMAAAGLAPVGAR